MYSTDGNSRSNREATVPYNPVFSFEFSEAYTDGLRAIPCRTRVTLLREGWNQPVIEILPGGEPLEWEWAVSDDDIFSPVRPMKLTLNLAVQDHWNPDLLNASGRYDIQVLVEKDRINSGTFQVAFLGWVQPDDARDSYGPRPYEKTISATDGLQLLEQKAALDPNGKPIAGPLQALSSILQACLMQTGNSLQMTTAVNLFHLADMAAGQLENGKPAAGKDPLYQTQVSTDWLIDDNNAVRNALDVIKGILIPFGCQLTQWDGQWWVRRVVEADGQHDPYNTSKQTIHIHKYTDQSTPYDAPLPGGVSLDQRVIVGDRESGEIARVVAGGPTTFLSPPIESLRVEQTFGRALDILNPRFNQLDSTGLPIGWQRRHKTQADAYGVGIGTETDPFAVVIRGYGDELLALNQPGILKVIELDPYRADFLIHTKFTLKADFLLNQVRAAQVTVFGVRKPERPLPYEELVLLGSDGKWKSNPSRKEQVTMRFNHSYDEATKTLPGPSSLSVTTDPIDKLIRLVILLGVGEDLDKREGDKIVPLKDPNAFTKFWNVRLENDRQNPAGYKGQGVTHAKAGRITPEKVATLTLGDTPDAVGPYSINSTTYDRAGNATSAWYEAGSSALDGTDLGLPLYRQLGRYQARQKAVAQEGFEGDIVGQLPHGPLSILLFTDIGEVDENGIFQYYPHIITRWKLLDRSAIHTVTAVRLASKDGPIAAPAPPNGPPDWILDGGNTVPQDLTGEGLPVPLPVTGTPTAPNPNFPNLPPNFFDQIYAGLNLPVFQNLPGLVPSGQAGNVTLTLNSGTGAPPVRGVAYYRPIDDNLYNYIDLDNGPA